MSLDKRNLPGKRAPMSPVLRNPAYLNSMTSGHTSGWQDWLAKLGLLSILSLLLGLLVATIWFLWVIKDVPTPAAIRANLISSSGSADAFLYSNQTGKVDSTEAVITTFNPRPLYRVNACGTGQFLDGRAMPVPNHFVKLLLASEDNDFCTHRGYDLRGMGVALFEYLRARLNNDDSRLRGASTITQQLAKNASCGANRSTGVRSGLLSCDDERTLARKVREIWIASQIEENFTKDEILALYLNSVRFWGRHQGLALASERYFRTKPDRLTLAQSALLVGVIKAATLYSPTRNWDLAFQQARDKVLRGSVNKATNADRSDDNLSITEQDYAIAVNELSPPNRAGLYDDPPWFAENVFTSWLRRTGQATRPKGNSDVKYAWVTTLDFDIQKKAEDLAKAFFEPGANGKSPAHAINADALSMIVLDRSGAVRAMIGGQRITTDPSDRATRRRRPPGSVIKPLVYAIAVENGCVANSIVTDRPLNQPGDPRGQNGKFWNPQNASGRFRGQMSLRQGLTYSVNTIAVQLAQNIQVGNFVGQDALDRILGHLGVDTTDAGPGAEGRRQQNALGLRPMTPLEVASTYLPYLNGGRAVRPYGTETLQQIFPNGRVYQKEITHTDQGLFSTKTAQQMIGLLHGVVNEPSGTGYQARIEGLDIIGKTGTTNDFKDAWFVGATNDLIAVVWVGRDDAAALAEGAYGGKIAGALWRQLMIEIYKSGSPRPAPPEFDRTGWNVDGPDDCVQWLKGG